MLAMREVAPVRSYLFRGEFATFGLHLIVSTERDMQKRVERLEKQEEAVFGIGREQNKAVLDRQPMAGVSKSAAQVAAVATPSKSVQHMRSKSKSLHAV